MNTVYLGLGSNLGNSAEILKRAIEIIGKQIGEVTLQSAFYDTTPWGFESEHRFVNAAIACETLLTPLDLLHQTQEIERQLGRTQKSKDGKYTDRLIDIDILLYNQLVFEDGELTIPHPLMHQRQFVLEPLQEIAPTLQHPTLHQSIANLFTLLTQQDLG